MNRALRWQIGEIGWEAKDEEGNSYLIWGQPQRCRGPGWLITWCLDVFNKDNVQMLLSRHTTVEKADERARNFHNALKGKP